MTEIIPSNAPSFDYDQFQLPENVSMVFHLSPHVNAQDLPEKDDLRFIFQEADIIVPEFVYSTESYDALAKIALGNTKVYQRMRQNLTSNTANGESFQTNIGALFSALYGTRIATANIDVHESFHSIVPMEKAISRFMSFINASNRAEKREDVVSAQTDVWDTFKTRDRAILENVYPVLDSTIKANRKLDIKRQNGPLRVDLFYGSTHKSLYNAMQTKNAIEPTEGFSASIAQDSYVDEFSEMYSRYLNGEIPSYESVERYLAYVAVISTLKRNGQINDATTSGREQSKIFLDLTEGMDLSDFYTATVQASKKFDSKISV